jgi:hypothetical protein
MRLSKSARSTSRTSALSESQRHSGAAAFGRGTADDAACGRAGASGASATFLSMKVCRRSERCKLCAPASSQRCCGLRPHRRPASAAGRHSARPSAALRCCRIRLHWPAAAGGDAASAARFFSVFTSMRSGSFSQLLSIGQSQKATDSMSDFVCFCHFSGYYPPLPGGRSAIPPNGRGLRMKL